VRRTKCAAAATHLLNRNPAGKPDTRGVAPPCEAHPFAWPLFPSAVHGAIVSSIPSQSALVYVDGLPIDEFARQHRLTVGERVRLLLQVLAAVGHERAVVALATGAGVKHPVRLRRSLPR
jgi:hypothetical protein